MLVSINFENGERKQLVFFFSVLFFGCFVVVVTVLLGFLNVCSSGMGPVLLAGMLGLIM